MNTPNALSEILAQATGPRYTSYPSADRFSEAVSERTFLDALHDRSLALARTPLSVYVHLPFCKSICYYCACNKVVTRDTELVPEYMEAVFREIDMVTKALRSPAPVLQLHLGGGTPTYLTDAQLELLVLKLESSFVFGAKAERSIEVDPRTVDKERLSALRAMGFNRLSLGVQDFNLETQKAVNRLQPFEQVAQLSESARALGFESLNFDFILGLPHQSLASMQDTLQKTLKLRPDRLALYNYAHLPERFKPQRRILIETLPSVSEKIAMQALAIETLQAAGYEHIGMDHFALPTDELAVAKRQGLLHRNFQGYTTLPDADLLGFGVSAISRVGATFTQNERDLESYQDAIKMWLLPIARGHVCGLEDLLRQHVIMGLMCQGFIDFQSVEAAFLIDFKKHFAREYAALESYAAAGHLLLSEDSMELTDTGWFLVRNIAMVFDAYLHQCRLLSNYSRVL